MKFTASFAILAAFVSQAVVSAAPTPVQFDSALEARADFTDGALEEVWSRYYDELLEEVEAREYEEEILERSPMKKFAQDVAVGIAQKAPTYAKQYSQSQESKARNSTPRMANVVQQAQQKAKPASTPKLPASSKWNTVKKPSVMAEIKKKGGFGSGQRRSLDADEEVFERGFGKDLAIGLGQKTPSYAKQYTQSKNAQIRNSLPRAPFVTAHQQSHSKPKSSSSGKKRSLDTDEEIFERGFGKDLAIGLGQKTPSYAKQYTQSNNAQIRNSLPRAPFVTAHQQSHSKPKSSSGGKKRSLDDIEEAIFERGFGKDLGIGLGQKAPSYAKQYTQSKNTQIRNSQPRAPFVTAHQQSHLKPKSSSGGSGKKRSLDADEEIFERGFGKDLAIGLAQKTPSYAKQYTQSKNAQIRNSLPRAPFVTAHQQSNLKPKSSSKKRSLDADEEIFELVL